MISNIKKLEDDLSRLTNSRVTIGETQYDPVTKNFKRKFFTNGREVKFNWTQEKDSSTVKNDDQDEFDWEKYFMDVVVGAIKRTNRNAK